MGQQPRKTADKVAGYGDLVGGIAAMLEVARRASARAVNAVMTATYWEIGRRIVEYEQPGEWLRSRGGRHAAVFPDHARRSA